MKKQTPLPSQPISTGILILLFLFAFAAVPAAVVAQDIIHVDADAGGANDGTSWTDAYTTLQDALDDAESGDEIWVAEGIYFPDEGAGQTDNDRGATFQLINGVEIYGGFAGGESTLGERDTEANPTILSGDIDGDDDPFEPETDSDSDPDTPTQTDHVNGGNSRHVVTGSGTDGTALLDGVTVTAGLADGASFPNSAGGGMLNDNGSPTLANLVFNGNFAEISGGGMSNEDGDPILTNVFFSGNSAGSVGGENGLGGGMFNFESNPTLTNVTFSGNSIGGEGVGGGMANVLSSNPTLTNVVFSGNSASQGGGMENIENSSPTLTNVAFIGNSAGGDFGGSGGGMRNRNDSSPTLTNVTFIGNSADNNGGGLFNFTSNPSLTNVIIWDNEAGGVTTSTSASIFNSSSTPVISHSLIANSEVSGGWNSDLGTDGGGNIIDREPLFRDTSDDGLHLANASPAINRGTNDPFGSGEPADGVTTDLAGNDRIRYTTVDMGAYEWEWNGGSTVFVDKNATGNNTGESWDDAFTSLQDGLAAARVANSDIDEVWVADGVYHPDEGAGQTDNDRGATFQLLNGVEIYGGFDGTESTLGARDVDANPTILSGDIDGNDTTTGGVVTDTGDISGSNSYHVVTGSGTDDTALLDGFTITAGLANIASGGTDAFGAGMLNENGSPALAGLTFSGNSARRSGGGMENFDSDPTLTNVTFSDNSSGEEGGGMDNEFGSSPILINVTFSGNSADDGGGMFNEFGSSPILINVTFSGNSARFDGGGMYNVDDSHPTLTNVTFSDNSSGEEGGGMLNVGDSHPTLTNVIFSGNSAGEEGGGMANGSNSNPTLTNVTFSGNSAGGDGGGMWNAGSDPTLTNVIIWNNEAGGVTTSTSASIFNFDDFSNPVISHSLIANSGGSGTNWEGAIGDDNGNNIDADPLFADPTDPDGADDTFGTEDDGLHLANASPAINGGTNDPFDGGVADGVTTDLAGNDRIRYTTVDMGAYEWEWMGGSTVFVDKNATGSNTGESWEDAFTDLQDALPIAPDIDEVWVANGVYTPTDNTDERDATFQLSSGLAVYGGFAGGEPNREDRDWGANPTILSGDIDGDDTSINGVVTDPDNISGNNSYQVVTGSGTNNTAILDGFTITAGNADGSSPKDLGGGMYNNDGSPTLFNISIIGNSAAFGGGIFNENSSPDLVNFLITGNSSGTDGGAMVNFANSHSVLTNGTFTGNSADDEGGAIYNEGGDPTLTNVIIWDNQANGSTTSGAASISNVISTPAISHSLIANSGGSGTNWEDAIGDDNGNNIDADPLFVDPTDPDGADDMFGTSDDGLALQDTSPAINTGDPSTDLSLFPGGPDAPLDLAGNPRVFDDDADIIDIGAYEFQGEPVTIPEQVVLSVPADEATNVGLTPEFSWQPVDGADEYQLQVSENSDLSDPVIDESGLTDTTFEPASDLANATTYYWRVRASNAAGDGQWSEVFSFTTLPESSEIVILTDPSDEATDVPLKPLFEWNPADGADSYDLVVSPNSDFSDPVIDEEEIEATEFQAGDDLDFSTTYYWHVRGVNSGGPGEWSETFSFTTLDQPEAADNRILLANTDSYTFTPADFGVADNSFTVVIDDLPGGFNGDLELDGSGVTTGNEISVGDIDDGDLVYTPVEDEYGYGFDSFGFSIKDNVGNPSDESYTMSLDVAATSVELTAAEGTSGEGWRFLGNPSDGDSYDDLLGPIWTKGVPGSDSPGALFPNIYTLDQPNYQWEAPSGLSNTTEPGRPFIVYVYSDDDNDGTPDGFPKTLTSGQNWLPLDGTFSFDELGYGESASNPDNFHLIANPHPVSLDFCGFADTNIGNAVAIWDPAANGGNGDYVSLSCGVDDVFIAPFQGFWVRTTDSSPVLEIPEAAYKQNPSGGYFKEKDLSGFENLTGLTLRIESTDGIFTNTARILFSEEASEGLDKWDAPKLSPAGLAERWLSFYSLDEEDMAYALQTLPTDFDEKLRIPLDIRTTESGPYILTWSLPSEALAQEGYFLRDNRTGQVVELREGAEYSFEIEPAQTSKVSETLEVLGKERSAKVL